jgi:hypothetical protein
MTALQQRTRSNVATVALANKLARIAWSVLSRNESYRLSVPAISIKKLWKGGSALRFPTFPPHDYDYSPLEFASDNKDDRTVHRRV